MWVPFIVCPVSKLLLANISLSLCVPSGCESSSSFVLFPICWLLLCFYLPGCECHALFMLCCLLTSLALSLLASLWMQLFFCPINCVLTSLSLCQDVCAALVCLIYIICWSLCHSTSACQGVSAVLLLHHLPSAYLFAVCECGSSSIQFAVCWLSCLVSVHQIVGASCSFCSLSADPSLTLLLLLLRVLWVLVHPINCLLTSFAVHWPPSSACQSVSATSFVPLAVCWPLLLYLCLQGCECHLLFILFAGS